MDEATTKARETLLDLARRWAAGDNVVDDARIPRHALLLGNHRHYRANIAVYRELCDSLSVGDDVDLDTIVNELMFSDQLFKSYAPGLPERAEFGDLTHWLRSLYSGEIPSEVAAVGTLSAWRNTLARHGVRLSYSSGTSGQMSFVPRDAQSWAALTNNGQTYSDTSWFLDSDGRPRPFACLVAGPRGTGLGIQGAAAGLTRMAARSHYLFDTELDIDGVLGAGSPDAGPTIVNAAGGAAPFVQARDFLRSAAEDKLRVLVFGAPFYLRQLCQQLAALGGNIELPAGSMVSTGGGWKSFAREMIPRADLLAMIERTLGIGAAAFKDVYSTAEINCSLIGCAEGRYHIPPLLEVVVLDEAFLGEIGAPGTGLVGFLDPFATSYPGFIITGDVATLSEGHCACGLHGPFIDGEIQRATNREVKGCGGVLAAALS
ncbi:MAG: hypothetical protein AAF458_02070 [Pseudomonadota bacterium]